MKRHIARILIAASILTTSVGVAPVTFVSCQQFGTMSQAQTDQVILKAEQTAQTARATFDLFVHLERDNEALLKKVNPSIHTYANTIRANGLNWIDSLRAATKTFEANRTSQNQANLNTWLVTLTNALTQTNAYIQQAKGAISQ